MKNIADILRNAPQGLKLYSSAFGNCKLSYVIEDEITIEYFDGKNPDFVTLDQYGRFKFDGECILFPHKFNLHSWYEWQEWLFRDELAIGKVVVDTIGGYFIIIRSEEDDIKVANSNGEEFVIESRDVDKYRFATIEDSADFLSKVGKNNCYWSNVEKTIIKNTHCCEPKYDTDEEPKEEVDETPIPCYEPKYFSCTGNCGYCVYHTTTGCSKTIEYDKSGCGWSSKYNSARENVVSSGEYNFCLCNKDNKYIPKLKVGDKACLSDKNDNIYFEEILKVNDEEYYTKTFGWINCKAIDELHEINFKEYNKPFTINDFKPFDKVLWRLGDDDTWSIGLYDNYYIAGENDKVSYSVLGYEKNWVPQCVPYNIDTAYLHDTDKEYDGKYKTW